MKVVKCVIMEKDEIVKKSRTLKFSNSKIYFVVNATDLNTVQ